MSSSAREATSEKLLEAAAREFNEHGFAGTDTNKIARRAGFAPQTFYRWFQDKVDIFIRVYERWQRDEFGDVDELATQGASPLRLARAVVAHHKSNIIFRRSLRLLSLENDVVRAARARSRSSQVAYVRRRNPAIALDDAAIATLLLQTERLADALAEGEFQDMNLANKAGEETLAALIRELLG